MSKSPEIVAAVILAVSVAGIGTAAETESPSSEKAESETQAEPGVSAPPPPKAGRVVYKPPGVGQPARTIGGGSRGVAQVIPAVFAIAPDHVGRTASAQPTLFWSIDRVPPEGSHVEFSLIDGDSIDPTLELELPAPDRAGLHRIALGDHGVSLDPGVEYQWSVALVLDPNERSKDVVATGWIDRREPSPDAAASLGRATAADYAEAGFFYDALSTLSDEIERDPSNAELRQVRSDLLEQVGLGEAASGS